MLANACNLITRHLLASICLLLLISHFCFAQNSVFVKQAHTRAAFGQTATLGGTIVDESGSYVSDARISVEGGRDPFKRNTMTGPDGAFKIPRLSPGIYIVDVRREGFTAARISNVALKVRDNLMLWIRLKGGVHESVTLDADALSDQDQQPNAISLGRLAENSPLSGRSIQPLIGLAPGAVLTRSPLGEQGQFSINGQRANANYFMVDGVSANIGVAAGAAGLGQSGGGSLPALSALGGTNSLVSVEALQEVKIQTGIYAPEFGRTPGAQIVLTTRSGTNQFRGTLFEYLRVGPLSAHDWFANSDRLTSSPSQENNFGGVLGGPIEKNTFFLVSYERLGLRLPQTSIRDVPSLAAREATPYQLKPFVNAFPLPNGPETLDGLAQFSASYDDRAKLNAVSIRLDRTIGSKVSIFGRYSAAPSVTYQRGLASSLSTLLRTRFSTHTLTFGATYVINPRVVNELRANYSQTVADKFYQLDSFGGAVPQIPSRFAAGSDSFYSYSTGGATSILTGNDATNLQRQINLVNNLTIVIGAHRLKFGVDFRRLAPVYGSRRYGETATFDGIAGVLAQSASSVAIIRQDRGSIFFNNFSGYAQDSWAPTKRLSLTYGLRWEFNPPPSGNAATHLVTLAGLDDQEQLKFLSSGTSPYRATYNNFAPRVGVALRVFRRPGRETILRSGLGVFYDLGSGPLANASISYPNRRTIIFSDVPYPLTPAQRERTSSLATDWIIMADPGLKLPYTLQWNMTVEQSLGSKQVISGSYVAAVGRRLLQTEALINPNLSFPQVLVTANRSSSSYHALRLQFERRLSKRFHAFGSYTWSHSIDDASNDSTPRPSTARLNPRLNRGPSDFDVRHSAAAAITYNIPFFKDRLLRNWSVDAIAAARSAAPVEVFLVRDLGFGPFDFRPDVVPGVQLYLNESSGPGRRLINRDAFSIPNSPRQGFLGRNALRAFPFSQLDLAVHRSFALSERLRLQARAEIFNVTNHPNFGDPVGDLGSGLFGRSTSTLGRSLGSAWNNAGFNPLAQTGGPRSIRLALKLQF